MQTKIPDNQIWKCSSCKSILGFISDDAEVLRVKYKDLLIYFNGGVIERNCRACGQWNTLRQESKKDDLLKVFQDLKQ